VNELKTKGLAPPFDDAFDPSKMKEDRIVNWLMRSLMLKENTLRNLALEHNIIMIGDSVHAQPIFGREGARAAVEDSINLAEWRDKRWQKGHKPEDFYDGRYEAWQKGVEASERNIVRLHKVQDRNEARSIPKI
jgi:2-polyprenyl-6-methoxyphenol hydroxylase-like FAD-dependent oxidoreductase